MLNETFSAIFKHREWLGENNHFEDFLVKSVKNGIRCHLMTTQTTNHLLFEWFLCQFNQEFLNCQFDRVGARQ